MISDKISPPMPYNWKLLLKLEEYFIYFHQAIIRAITVVRRGKARQGKARQGKARQGKARQGKARQGKARQGKARQGKARQGT